MEPTWVDTFELIMKGLLVNILGFLGIVANILIIIVLQHRKMKSSISLIMMGNLLQLTLFEACKIKARIFLKRFLSV